MEFIYKNKQYTWEEFGEEKDNFIESLQLPDTKTAREYRECCILHDIGYGIALEKLLDYYRTFTSARFALINAHEKFFDSNYISWESGYRGQLWLRSEYLRNSIIWYNSCEDFLYQVLWFAFELHSKPISNRENYISSLKECTYSKLKIKLEKIGSDEANSLLDKVDEYRFDKDVAYLRDDLANYIKHKEAVQFEGLEDRSMMGFVIKNQEGTDKFNRDWISPKVIDIDETINTLKEIHIKLMQFSDYILEYLNLENMFEIEDGAIVLNTIKKKDSYKKIYKEEN